MKIEIGDYVKAKINGKIVQGFVEIVYATSVDIMWYGELYNIKKSEIYYVQPRPE